MQVVYVRRRLHGKTQVLEIERRRRRVRACAREICRSEISGGEDGIALADMDGSRLPIHRSRAGFQQHVAARAGKRSYQRGIRDSQSEQATSSAEEQYP